MHVRNVSPGPLRVTVKHPGDTFASVILAPGDHADIATGEDVAGRDLPVDIGNGAQRAAILLGSGMLARCDETGAVPEPPPAPEPVDPPEAAPPPKPAARPAPPPPPTLPPGFTGLWRVSRFSGQAPNFALDVIDPGSVGPFNPTGTVRRPLTPGEIVRLAIPEPLARKYWQQGYLEPVLEGEAPLGPDGEPEAPSLRVVLDADAIPPGERGGGIRLYVRGPCGEPEYRILSDGVPVDVVAPSLGQAVVDQLLRRGILRRIGPDGRPEPAPSLDKCVRVTSGHPRAPVHSIIPCDADGVADWGKGPLHATVELAGGIKVRVHAPTIPSMEPRLGTFDGDRCSWSRPLTDDERGPDHRAPDPEPEPAQEQIEEGKGRPAEPAADRCAAWLRQYLADHGTTPTVQIVADANVAGFSTRTLERAKAILGIRAKRRGAHYEWSPTA